MHSVKFQFIEPEQSAPNVDEFIPASYVRFAFQAPENVESATLYTTALGVYEPYFNGTRISEQRLLPGFTNYHVRVQYLTTDITGQIVPGKNVVSAVIGDGWYRGSLGPFTSGAFYGEKIKFAASVCIRTADGETWFYTDASTKATQNGPLRETDLKTDEVVDMTMDLGSWTAVDYDDSDWHTCLPAFYDGDVIPQEGEDILEQERFAAKVLHTPNGQTVLDFGQNMAGHVEFTVTGTAGTTVKLVMGEALDEEGNFTLKNLADDDKQEENQSSEMMTSITGRLGQVLTYTLKDGTQTYKSVFLTSGFRYAKVLNWPEEVRAENFTAISVYSDYKRTGSFSCSNPRINQFVSNVKWAQNSNFVDIPTDCPQRERAGWTGDIDVFAETACYLTNTERFLLKWFGDYVSLQKKDGSLPFIVPEIPMMKMGPMDMMTLPWNSAGWSDALINVAMVLYRFYGNKGVLEQVYDAAKKFIDYDLRRSAKNHVLHTFKRSAHYKYILDTGYHWGEWLEPGSSNVKDGVRAMLLPDAEVATAWLFHSTKQVSEMAEILGNAEDSKKYRNLASKIRDAYRKEFLNNGTVRSKRQCRYVRPVYMGLVTETEARKIMADLNKKVIANDYKIGTGFLTTYQVLQTLTDYGYADTAYKMMEQEQCPGWLYEVNRGATTTWEAWDAVGEDGSLKTVSLNHYAPGAACAWLFSHVGGIQPLTPGFSEVRIKPIPGGTLTYADTTYESRHGTIVSNWKRNASTFSLHVEVPEGVKATVVLPDGSTQIAPAGASDYTCSC